MSADINVVALTGRLTRDPEVKQSEGGTTICRLRLAFTTRRKAGGNWEDHSNFLDVTVFGNQGDSVGKNLAKGRQIGVSGRLEWREWEGDSGKRQSVSLIADSVRFLGSKPEGSGSSGAAAAEEDIPF